MSAPKKAKRQPPPDWPTEAGIKSAWAVVDPDGVIARFCERREAASELVALYHRTGYGPGYAARRIRYWLEDAK